VTPGSLVATALLAHDRRGIAEDQLFDACDRLARTLRRAGARFSPSLGALGQQKSGVREALDLFTRAGHVEAHRVGGDAIYVVPAEARMSLDLAKNVIMHFFVARALIATTLLVSGSGGTPGVPAKAETVRERVLALSRLFKHEFTFRADARFETIFDEEVAAMEQDGELARVFLDGDAAGGLAPRGEDGRIQVELYARLVENFIDGYRIAARGLAALLKGPLALKDVVKRAIPTGERMFLAGEIARREAVSSPLLENAYASFVDQGYLSRAGGKLALTESYATQSAVGTIEARIAAMGARAPG
jgi:glycerol-3-phosphate O-acyltransferase